MRHTSESPIFSDSMWVDAWPQERDRPASNLATGNAENAGMARITLARHKYSAGGTSVLSRNFKNSALPGAINLVFYDGHAELAANEKLWQFRCTKIGRHPHSARDEASPVSQGLNHHGPRQEDQDADRVDQIKYRAADVADQGKRHVWPLLNHADSEDGGRD